jgi:hypothetical protein
MGQVNALVKIIGGVDSVMEILRRNVDVHLIKHIIDLDADPAISDDWVVEEHRKGGQLEWHPNQIFRYRSKAQKGNMHQDGNDLRQKLNNQVVLNANALDYLLAHPHLIPEEWGEGTTLFWGTIYCRRLGGDSYVRCLWAGHRGWDSDYILVANIKHNMHFAAVRAKVRVKK